MAEHSEVAYTTADGNDYPAHEQTYEGFIKLVKYGSAFVIFILAMMAIAGRAATPVTRSENCPRSGCKTSIHPCGNSDSLLVRVCLAPPEAS
jgi:hypothetical protein